MISQLPRLAFIAVMATFIFGCAQSPRIHATKFTSYEDFRPGPEGGVDLVWARIGLRDADRLKRKLDKYDSVVIDQVFVLAEEDSITDEEIEELTAYFVQRLSDTIKEHKPVVESPTDRSLRLSIALSNVETPNPILAVTSSVLPYGLAISTISKITTGEHTNVGSATIELLVSDAENGDALFAVVDRQAGNKDFSTMLDSLDDPKDAINFWVDRLSVTLHKIEKPE